MAEERNENKNLTHETLWNDYQNATYLANMGFTQNIPIYVDFLKADNTQPLRKTQSIFPNPSST